MTYTIQNNGELNMIKVSQADFNDYKEVQESGVCNMFDITTVSNQSGLDKDTIKAIMRNYDELLKIYN